MRAYSREAWEVGAAAPSVASQGVTPLHTRFFEGGRGRRVALRSWKHISSSMLSNGEPLATPTTGGRDIEKEPTPLLLI
eukprot:366391-Chlamydomonas_euryale.AAC.3